MTLTTDEKNIIRIYDEGSRTQTLHFLPAVQYVLLMDEENELYDLVESVLDKLEQMTDEEYDAVIAEPIHFDDREGDACR